MVWGFRRPAPPNREGGAAVKKVWLIKGTTVHLTGDSILKARAAARHRHEVNASNTRGAGTNYDYHLKGTIGEQAQIQLMGLKRGPECSTSWSTNPDIWESNPHIEVKNGAAVARKLHFNANALWVVFGAENDDNPYVLRLKRMAMGRDVLEHAIVPLWLPRAANENWEIPDLITEIEVTVS